VVRKSRTAYKTLNEWMQGTGTNARHLIELMAEAGEPVSKGHMSDILSGSRRCSLRKAVVLNAITGVPVEAIIEWPKVRKFRLVRSVA
jgi:hypothetical protein